MTISADYTRAHKHAIIQDLFIDTADDNYVAARWCFVEGLNIDYLWLAAHALEKYMKAVLLLNDKTTKNFSHNIVKLYKEVTVIAPDLLPKNMEQPDRFKLPYWIDETFENYVKRLYHNGNPDNRYLIYGFVKHNVDLFKLDSAVFALRRLCVPLDTCYNYPRRPETKLLTYREKLKTKPDTWRMGFRYNLEQIADGKRGEHLRHVFLNFNFPFAGEDFPHDRMEARTAAKNPIIVRYIIEPLKHAPESNAAAMAEELRDWMLDNIQLPEGVKRQLHDARSKAKPVPHRGNR